MPPNELQRLLPRHYKILRLCIEGLTRKEIALGLSMSPEGVGLIINSPLFQDELAKHREVSMKDAREISNVQDVEAINILQEAASDAARKHVDLLNSDNDRTAQMSANSILDRVMASDKNGVAGIKIDQNVINLLQITINELKDDKGVSSAPPIEREDVLVK